MKTIIVFYFILLGSIIFNSLQAQEQTAENSCSADLFANGSMIIAAYLEHYNSLDEDRDISITQVNVETGFYLLYGLSLNGNAYLFLAQGERIPDNVEPPVELNADVAGTGFNGFVRWDFLRLNGHSLFVEAGAGMVFTTDDFPPGGTSWNFSRRHGFGASIRLNKTRIVAGWRDMHISNGKGFGHPRNPAFDGRGFYIGLRF